MAYLEDTANKDGIANWSMPPESKLASMPTPREEKLDAIKVKDPVVEEEETKEIGSMYPTNAQNMRPTPPELDPLTRGADFYREGAYRDSEFTVTAKEEYSIAPRRFRGWEYDEKIASIRLFGPQPGKSDSVDLLPPYTKFFLENVQEGHAEKTQIVETFGKFYVYSFGERPPMYTFSGKLMSTKNADWASDFNFLYDQYLRSTRAVERKAKVIITYGGKQVEGLVVSLSTTKQADVEGAVPFQIQMIVFERKFLNFSNDFGFSTGDGKSLNRDESFQKMLNDVTGGRSGLGTSDPRVSAVTKAAKGIVKNTLPAQGPMGGLTDRFSGLA